MPDSGEPGDLSPSVPPADGVPLKAAGILFIAEDGRVLLMRRTGRDHAGEWAFPGGGVEDGESPENCARRETVEETALRYAGRLELWTRRIKDGVDFTTFIGRCEKFVPALNAEHDIATWVRPDIALATLPMHPGAAVALRRFDMNELDIAHAIVSGDLVSPQRYENVLLVALRITGTGAAYRGGKLNEYVWRDPSLYLNDEFLERCQGLTVIWDHPKKRMMNSKEFNRRVVGSIMLPFIREQDVWGVAKVYDEEAVEELPVVQWSTSPGVKLKTGLSQKLEDGSKLLLEGDLKLLDHVAICALGMWDKGEGPTGVDVVLDSQGTGVAQILDLVYTRELASRC